MYVYTHCNDHWEWGRRGNQDITARRAEDGTSITVLHNHPTSVCLHKSLQQVPTITEASKSHILAATHLMYAASAVRVLQGLLCTMAYSHRHRYPCCQMTAFKGGATEGMDGLRALAASTVIPRSAAKT